MQEMNEKMTIWRESISLNHEKSKRLFTITDEIKKMKAIGKKIIKVSLSDLPSIQKDEAVQTVKFMLREANSVSKQARKFHLLDATPEAVQQLEVITGLIKEERVKLEDISNTLFR